MVKFLYLVSGLFVFLFLISLVFVSGIEKGKIDQEVIVGLEENEKISVYVKFGEEEKGIFSFFEDSIEESKDGVIEDIGKEEVKYEDEDELYINIKKGDLETLEKKNNVKKVELEGQRRLFLQDTKEIVNASNAWNFQIGGENITGVGESVCVIDSGIDYGHAGFGSCSEAEFLDGNCTAVPAGHDFVNLDSDPMDDNGHGTHVSGIVRGIAPDVGIIAVKACSAAGVCSDSAISAGINWCIGNATALNISVISMSLGSGSFSENCDGDALADEIANALENNISVVVASGNAGNKDKISAPACVSGAIAVGATDKDDSIASYSDRNSLVKLLAPGTGINSSVIGSYGLKTGTSMATPHVSAAISLLNVFLNLTGQKGKTPSELEKTLNDTGKVIEDTGDGAVGNYSRINIYDAIISLDLEKPIVNLVSPKNDTLSSALEQSFNCNATDLSLDSLEFYLWDSNNSLVNSTSFDIEGNSASLEINVSNLTLGESYNWNCLFSDSNENRAFAEGNYSLKISGLEISLETPVNGSYLSSVETDFVCNSESEESYSLTNVTLNLWNSSNLVYEETRNVSGERNSTAFNYTIIDDGEYNWNCLAFNNNSDSIFGESNRSFIFDSTKPAIVLETPSDGNSSFTGAQNVNYKFNVSDSSGVSSCSLILNDVNVKNNESVLNLSGKNIITYNTGVATHTWGINCIDLAGNIGNSSRRELTVNSVPVEESAGSDSSGGSSSGGGGGGGGGSSSSGVSGNTVASINAKKNETSVNNTESNSGSGITGNIIQEDSVESNESVNDKGNRFGITGLAVNVGDVVSDYGFFVLVLITLLVLFLVGRMWYNKRKKVEENSKASSSEKTDIE